MKFLKKFEINWIKSGMNTQKIFCSDTCKNSWTNNWRNSLFDFWGYLLRSNWRISDEIIQPGTFHAEHRQQFLKNTFPKKWPTNLLEEVPDEIPDERRPNQILDEIKKIFAEIFGCNFWRNSDIILWGMY